MRMEALTGTATNCLRARIWFNPHHLNAFEPVGFRFLILANQRLA